MSTNRQIRSDARAPYSPAPTRTKFNSWVAKVGGSRAAAAVLRCSRSYVDMLRSGDRRPGLDLAYRIERVTGGAIRMPDWLPATGPGTRHGARPTREA